jgi:hypothetical protein
LEKTAGAGTRTEKQSLKRGRRSAIKKVVASSRDQTFVRVQDTKALTATSTRGQCHYRHPTRPKHLPVSSQGFAGLARRTFVGRVNQHFWSQMQAVATNRKDSGGIASVGRDLNRLRQRELCAAPVALSEKYHLFSITTVVWAR